jgi:hypothetical protein
MADLKYLINTSVFFRYLCRRSRAFLDIEKIDRLIKGMKECAEKLESAASEQMNIVTDLIYWCEELRKLSLKVTVGHTKVQLEWLTTREPIHSGYNEH